MAGDPAGPQCADRRPDRLGQDACGLPGGDRRAVPAGLDGRCTDETQVVYVSPLKALSNDIQRTSRSRWPASARRCAAGAARRRDPRLRCAPATRPPAERERMRRRPPHILVTTPESLYILLSSATGRGHALDRHARSSSTRSTRWRASKRGVASRALARTAGGARGRAAAAHRPLGHPEADRRRWRASWSAPATAGDAAQLHDHRYRPSRAQRDLAHRGAGLAARSGDVGTRSGSEIYDRLAALIDAHRTTLVFVNTRRLAERVARHLSDRLGEENVTAHHGSLAQGAAPRRRAAAQGRQAEGAGGHGLARARHRYRRRRSRLPARLAALDRDASCSASAGPATPSAARRRAGCSRCRATSWSNARRCSTASRAASSTASSIPDAAARRAGAADRRRGRGAANGARTSFSHSCAGPGPIGL